MPKSSTAPQANEVMTPILAMGNPAPGFDLWVWGYSLGSLPSQAWKQSIRRTCKHVALSTTIFPEPDLRVADPMNV